MIPSSIIACSSAFPHGLCRRGACSTLRYRWDHLTIRQHDKITSKRFPPVCIFHKTCAGKEYASKRGSHAHSSAYSSECHRLEDLLVESPLSPNLSTLSSCPTPTSLTYTLLKGEPLGLDLHTALLSLFWCHSLPLLTVYLVLAFLDDLLHPLFLDSLSLRALSIFYSHPDSQFHICHTHCARNTFTLLSLCQQSVPPVPRTRTCTASDFLSRILLSHIALPLPHARLCIVPLLPLAFHLSRTDCVSRLCHTNEQALNRMRTGRHKHAHNDISTEILKTSTQRNFRKRSEMRVKFCER